MVAIEGRMVGTSLGVSEAVLVGEVVMGTTGTMVGPLEGLLEVGASTGAREGMVLGRDVGVIGAPEGGDDGVLVGAADDVGAGLGGEEGTPVGAAETVGAGEIVGTAEGPAEGESVGEADSISSPGGCKARGGNVAPVCGEGTGAAVS